MDEKKLKQFLTLTKPDIKFDPHRPGFVQHEADEVDEFDEDIGISKRCSKRRIRTTNEGPAALNVTLNGVEIKADYSGESSDAREFNDVSKSQEDGINEQHDLMPWVNSNQRSDICQCQKFKGQEYEDEAAGRRWKWQPSQKWKKSKMIIDQQGDDNENEGARTQVKEQIEMNTGFSTLLALGQRNLYDTPREALIKRYEKIQL
jgi:hypothetical protein